MKIKHLIKKLEPLHNPEGIVYLLTESGYYNFMGFSTDDNKDVQLYVTIGDKEA